MDSSVTPTGGARLRSLAVRRPAARRLAVLVVLGVVAAVLPLVAVRADTGETVRFTCPLCGTTFEDFRASSGTTFGRRLDFKAVGPTYSPWPVPRCTHCGFVLYADELAEEEKQRLRTFVASDAYAPFWKDHTDFYCLGLILEACEDPDPMELGSTFLKATWELAPGDERYLAYASRAIGCFARVRGPAEDTPADEEEDARQALLVARYLQVELHRRSGAFADAKRVLAEIAGLDQGPAPAWYARAVAYQGTLVGQEDRAPHTFRDLPPAESKDAEQRGEGEKPAEER